MAARRGARTRKAEPMCKERTLSLDRDEDVEEVTVAFDRPEEYDELWSEDGCVLATPLCGRWVVLNFCERRIDTISDVIREYSGGKVFAAAKLFAEDPGR